MKQSSNSGRGTVFARFLAISALTLASSLTVQANLIQNGSFEGKGSGSLSGWTSCGVNVVDGLGRSFDAANGNYFANLNGLGCLSTGSIATTPGKQYTLTFDFGSSGSRSQAAVLDVWLGCSTLGGVYKINGKGSASWQTFTCDFTATSYSTTIYFEGMNLWGCGDWSALDDCRLEQKGLTSAVPEAGTTVAGLLLLAPLALGAGRILSRRHV